MTRLTSAACLLCLLDSCVSSCLSKPKLKPAQALTGQQNRNTASTRDLSSPEAVPLSSPAAMTSCKRIAIQEQPWQISLAAVLLAVIRLTLAPSAGLISGQLKKL